MALNFRQFGGQTSEFGGKVRSGRLFRAGAPIDRSLLDMHNFALIADLRHSAEHAAIWPAPWNERVIPDMSSSVSLPPHLGLMDGGWIDSKKVRTYYVETYRTIPVDERYRFLFREFLNGLADLKNESTALVCCSAGKDRTGILIALLGHLLGVSRDDIMQDYLLSGTDPSRRKLLPLVRDNARASCGQEISDALAEKILGVAPEYLETMYDSLNESFGGVMPYLESIGVSALTARNIRENWLD